MKVLNREKVIGEFGSLTGFAKTIPTTLSRLHQLTNAKRKHYRDTESGTFKLAKLL
jgi:hypothetical protein